MLQMKNVQNVDSDVKNENTMLFDLKRLEEQLRCFKGSF
jgi:hypothetical protein